MAKARAKRADGKQIVNTLPLYILLIILFVLYVIYQHGAILSYIVGIALFLTLVSVILIETLNGIREYGFRRNVIEIIVVVLVVIGVWFALQFFLGTKYPLDVVPSCSMLPSLQRGDMLLLQGIKSPVQLKAPTVSISRSTYSGILGEIGQGELACIAYKSEGTGAQLSQYMEPGYTIGLFNGANGGSVERVGSQTGPIIYQCGLANVKFSNGTTKQVVYTSGISIAGRNVSGDRNNSVVVYGTIPQDLFYQEGDGYIVHRVYAVLNVSGSYYVLTKGDNNPGLDIQYSNYPVNLSYVQGKVIASVPYLGYLKLILSSRFVEPAGCNSTIQN